MGTKFKQLRKFIIALSVFPGFSANWGKRAALAGISLVKQRQLDIVIASHPYMGSLRAGHTIAKATGIPWIADFRDPWANDPQSIFLGTPILLQMLRRMEGRMLATAAAVVAINRQLADLLCIGTDRVAIIPNSFDPIEAPLPHSADPTRSAPINLVYTGTLLANHQYAILIHALAQCVAEGVDVPLRIHYYGTSSRLMMACAREVGLSLDYFEDHGLLPHREVLKIMSEADLLLLLGWRGEGGECVVSGKVFDYLCSNTPIAAVGASEKTAMARLIQETGGGIALSNVEDTVRFLKELAANGYATLVGLRSMRNEETIQRYWTTHTATQFEMLIDSVLRRKIHRSPN